MSKITLFTSGGREYAACPTPEGANSFYIYGKKLLCYYVKVEGVEQHVEMSQSLPDGDWTIMGHLNSISYKEQIKLTEDSDILLSALPGNPLILFKQ